MCREAQVLSPTEPERPKSKAEVLNNGRKLQAWLTINHLGPCARARAGAPYRAESRGCPSSRPGQSLLRSFQISGPTCTSYKHTVCAQPYKKAHTAHARGRQRRRAGRVDRFLPTFSWQANTTPSTRAAGERTLSTRSDRLRPNLRKLGRAAPPLLPRPNRPERAAPLSPSTHLALPAGRCALSYGCVEFKGAQDRACPPAHCREMHMRGA